MTTNKQTIWRESASLLLVAPKTQNTDSSVNAEIDDHDYELLMLKRSERTASADNHAVFPGGLLERQSDESVEWLQYFEEFGIQQQQLKQLVIINDQRPRILLPQGTGCYDRFFKRTHIWAREISLRLTAIREAFEEVGVLLCRTRSQLNAESVHAPYACYTDDFDKAHWQQLVHNEPKQFLQLCRYLRVVPDLWGLSEWAVWASPAAFKKGYETAFFVAFVREKPQLLAEQSEVQSMMWHTPRHLLRMYLRTELWLMPPQIYEIARFLSITSLQKLHAYVDARRKAGKGCLMYIPILYMCSDGMVSVVRGDSAHLADVFTQYDIIQVKETVAEFRAQAKRLHRLENPGLPHAQLILNFKLPDANIAPACNWQQLHKL